MNTPIKEHSLGGTPANSKRKTVAAVVTPLRNVRPKWDLKKTALAHLCEAEQDEERLRPVVKGACASKSTELELRPLGDLSQQHGSDTDVKALLDSVTAKAELLRKHQQHIDVLDRLPSDKAKHIPLVFDNLLNCAKQLVDKPIHDKAMKDLRKERDNLLSERQQLLSKQERPPKDNYYASYLAEFQRANELSKECKTLRSEKRQSEDDHNKLYLDERRRTTELTRECEELRSELDEAKSDVRREKEYFKLCRESFYDLSGEKAAVKEQLKQTKAEREALEEDLEDLREEHVQALAELRTATNSEKQDLQDQITELTEARNAEVATSSNLQNELHVLQNSYAKEIISKQAAAIEDRRKCLSEQKDRHQSETAKMQEDHRLEIGKKNGRIHRLEQDKRDFKGQITKMKKEHSLELRKKQEQIQRLERDNGHHKGRITEITQEHRLQVEEKEDQILRLEQDKASIEGQTAGLEIDHQIKLEKTRDQILQLKREINSFGGGRAELEANHRLELVKRRDRVLGLEQENDGYKEKIDDMEAQHQVVIEQKESRIQLLARENNGYVREKTKEIEGLQAELEAKQDRIRALEQEKDEYTLEKTRKIQDLQTKLQRAVSSQEGQNDTLEKLSDDIVKKKESVEKLRTKNAVYERERQFQLGFFDRSILFDEFSNHAKNMLGGTSCAGEIGGQPVNVCICVPADTNDILLVVRRYKDDAYMVWQSRMEDYTTFQHDWRFWIRLEGGMEAKPVYIAMDLEDKVRAWTSSLLASWVLSMEEKENLV